MSQKLFDSGSLTRKGRCTKGCVAAIVAYVRESIVVVKEKPGVAKLEWGKLSTVTA